MMGNTNTQWLAMSDRAILSTIGNFVKEKRLSFNKTQVQIAEQAGLNRWTLSQLEKGESITLLSLLQIIRALDLLHIFEIFKIETPISPIELAKIERKKQRRARRKDHNPKPESDW